MTVAQVPRRRIRVIVAHGDAEARRGIRDTLASRSVAVVATTASAVEALELARHYRADVLIVDAQLRTRRGGAVLPELAAAGGWGTIALLADADAGDVEAGVAALRSGAVGVVADVRSLADAVGVVAAGGATAPPDVVLALVRRLQADRPVAGLRPVRSALTTREWEVLDLLCAGRSTREIAAVLHLTEDTVYGHVKRILRKLGVRTRADAVSLAGALRAGAQIARHEPDRAVRLVTEPPRV